MPPLAPERPPATAARKARKRNDRALQALDEGIYALVRATKVHVAAEQMPPGTKIRSRLLEEAAALERQAFDGFMRVRVALGYDPEAEEPQPAAHWDKGAMKED